MKKRTKQAINALTHHIENLEVVSNTKQGNTWKASVRATFNLYLGKESALSDRLSQLYFTKAILFQMQMSLKRNTIIIMMKPQSKILEISSKVRLNILKQMASTKIIRKRIFYQISITKKLSVEYLAA